jgi:cytochrome c556
MKRVFPVPRVLPMLVLALMPAVAAADDQDSIDYRKHIMQTLHAQTSALGMIMSGAIPDDNVIAHIDTLAITAATALKSFEPKVEGGDAKPEVWTNWDDFAARMNDFAAKTAQMAKTAHEQGKDEALLQAVDALSCKGCHDDYNTKDPTE